MTRRTMIVDIDAECSDELLMIVMRECAELAERRLGDPFTRTPPTARVEIVSIPTTVPTSALIGA